MQSRILTWRSVLSASQYRRENNFETLLSVELYLSVLICVMIVIERERDLEVERNPGAATWTVSPRRAIGFANIDSQTRALIQVVSRFCCNRSKRDHDYGTDRLMWITVTTATRMAAAKRTEVQGGRTAASVVSPAVPSKTTPFLQAMNERYDERCFVEEHHRFQVFSHSARCSMPERNSQASNELLRQRVPVCRAMKNIELSSRVPLEIIPGIRAPETSSKPQFLKEKQSLG